MRGKTASKNIYEMYVANGNKAGFWVKRNTWTWQAALVVSVGGMAEGPLHGKAPYFNNPPVVGLMGGIGREVPISCPGSYGYVRIEVKS